MIYTYMFTRMAKIKRWAVENVGEDMEKLELSYTADESVQLHNHVGR